MQMKADSTIELTGNDTILTAAYAGDNYIKWHIVDL